MKNTLQSMLRRGRVTRPQKSAIYGPEGVGKTTLAAQAPNPVFLDTEGGTDHLDVARLTADKWEDIIAIIHQLATEPHEFRTLVIDTIDWLEKRLAEFVCRRASKESIEDFGYGKGHVIVAEEMAKFLASLDGLLKRGMHIILLAHSTVKKFEMPDAAGSYDRFELKLSKQVAPLIKEWADLVLFCNYVTRVAENDQGKRRGVGGRERVLHTSHTAAWDAKNRHGLEEKLPFTYEAIAKVFGEVSAPVGATAEPSIGEKLAGLVKGREADVLAFLIARGQLKENGSLDDLPPEYAARILGNPIGFLEAVEKFNAEVTPIA
jgi:hypothetical protein